VDGGSTITFMTSKMTRREILTTSTTLLLLVPVAAACSSSNNSSGGTEDAGNGCNGVFETSTVTNGHTHTLCVPTTDLTNPPAAGVTYTTSFDAGHTHTHTVVLTQAQLQTINGGGSVTVTTSSPASHNFTIAKS
jgi:hypothetical protein